MTKSSTSTLPGERFRSRSTARRITWFAIALGGLMALGWLSISVGSRGVTLVEVLSALDGSDDTVAEAAIGLRVPRTALAALVGAALAVAGASMQAVTRNPIADPGILGVTAGAALAVVISIVVVGVSAPLTTMAIAVGGAAIVSVFVYAVGSLGSDGPTPLKLTLAGAAISAACLSLISAIMLPRVDLVRTFQFWQIGGVGGATWDRILIAAPFIIVGAGIVLSTARSLNALSLGDELARGLGSNVTRSRLISSLGAVILCGVATAIAGPIGFVGLIVPHAARLLVGGDYRWVFPISAVLGAALLIVADVAGRVVTRPAEIPVGLVTAFIGAPVFIWIIRRRKIQAL